MTQSESYSVMSDSLRPHGLYSPWNSLGQNNGLGGEPFPSPGDFPIEPRSSALQVDSSPIELSRKTQNDSKLGLYFSCESWPILLRYNCLGAPVESLGYL